MKLTSATTDSLSTQRKISRQVPRLLLLAILSIFCLASNVYAADEGQTRPRLSYGEAVGTGTYAYNLIPLTSGSGNVKGIYCYLPMTYSYNPTITVEYKIDGGATQSTVIAFAYFPQGNTGGFIPLNVRFSSSIQVLLRGGFTYYNHNAYCIASWGLD